MRSGLGGIIGLILFFVCHCVYGDSNVLVNPGFEEGTTGWSDRYCQFETVDWPVRSGSRSGRAYNRTETWQGIRQDMLGKMVAGGTYEISGWVRIGSGSDTAILTVEQTDGAGTNYHRIDTAAVSSSGWVQLSGSFTLTVSGTLTALFVYFEGPAAGADLYVDDAVVYGPEAGAVEPEASGLVDADTRHQVIEGFGAAGAWYEGWLTDHPQREALYDLFFRQLGLDIYRLRNTYDQGPEGAEYMSRSAQIVTEAKERNPNLKILICSWSPPTYLKSNGQINGGGDATLVGGPGDYDYAGFANWWADSLEAWAGYGVEADYISIQNEPDYDASWDSCRFDPAENTHVAGYDRAFEAVYQELVSRFGPSMPNMLGPESTGFYGASGSDLSAYLSAIIDSSHVYGYCHHLYNIGAGDDPDAYLTAMQNFHSQWGSKPLFQTEYEKSTAAWPDAYHMALLLHHSLTVEQVSGYLYWSLFWAEPEGLVGFPSYGSSSYTIHSDFYGFQQFSAFVHSGWQRVEAVTDSSALRISAYVAPDDRQLTVVLINTSPVTDISTMLTFGGFAVGGGQVYRTSQTENCVLIGGYDGSGPVVVPARSVVTLSLSARSPYGDLTGDGVVDLEDLPLFLECWMSEDCGQLDLNGDDRIDLTELAELAGSWL